MVNLGGNYQGGVFSKDIDGGRAGAEITLSLSEIRAVASTGQQFTLRYSDCQIEIGGASGKMVFCRKADKSLTIFCEDKGFLRELRQSGGGYLDEQIIEAKQGKARDARRFWKIAITLVIVMGGLLVGGYFAVTWAAREAVMAMPVSVDQKIGQLAMSQMQLDGPEVTDKVVVQAVQEMIDRLKPQAAITEFDYKLKVIDAEIMNAFALPGGYMVVYTGLIKKATRPEQVAGVIAHEMSHASLRHGLTRISQSLTIAVCVTVLFQDIEGLVVFSVEIARALAMSSYSREQETDADLEGLRMLQGAKIDPRGLSEMFKIMQAENEGGLVENIPEWFSTHPDMGARIQEVENSVDALPKVTYNPLSGNWDDVLKRLNRSQDVTGTEAAASSRPAGARQ